MTEINVLIEKMRKDKKISIEQVCKGICSETTFHRYERGERVPDILTLVTLLERMGKGIKEIDTYISAEEYQYILLVTKALDYVRACDIEGIENMLMVRNTEYPCVNAGIREQFDDYLQAYVTYKRGNISESIEILRRAVYITMPGFFEENIKNYLLSSSEIYLLLLLAEIYIAKQSYDDAELLLSSLESRISECYDDLSCKVKVYPRTIRLYSEILIRKTEYNKCIALCSNAINLLIEQDVIYGLASLLEIYSFCTEKCHYAKKTNMYKLCARILRDSYKEAGFGEIRSFCYNKHWQSMNELLADSRRRAGMTIEQASDGICAPETLSRIENKKHAPRPNTFKALMNKYEIVIKNSSTSIEAELWTEKSFWKRAFKGCDLYELSKLADSYIKQGESDKSVCIWTHIVDMADPNIILSVDIYKLIVDAIKKLCSVLSSRGENIRCIMLCRKGIDICLRTGRYFDYSVLWGIISELDQMSNDKYIIWAFCLSYLFGKADCMAYYKNLLTDKLNIRYSFESPDFSTTDWDYLDGLLNQYDI